MPETDTIPTVTDLELWEITISDKMTKEVFDVKQFFVMSQAQVEIIASDLVVELGKVGLKVEDLTVTLAFKNKPSTDSYNV